MLAAGGLPQEQKPPPPDENSGDQVINLYKAGRYAEATVLAERILALAEKEGTDEIQLARACYVLASLYNEQGFYERALRMFERALGIYKRLGNPPEMAMTLNNMSSVYINQANFKSAIPLLHEVVEILEKEEGKESGMTATALNNLALAYYEQGDYAKAIPMFQRSLEIVEKVSGKEHPDVAHKLTNLGVVFSDMGDDERALKFHLRAMQIYEKSGVENPDLALALFNVASKYTEDKDYEHALPLLERAQKIYEQSLGPKHPEVATVLDTLAEVHLLLHKDEGRAMALLLRSLEIRKEVLGESHPQTAVSLINLASMYFYQNQQDYERVLPLLRSAIAIYENALGAEHPTLGQLLTGLSEIYSLQGKYDDSISLLQRSGDLEEKNLDLILSTGSQRQKQLYLDTNLYRTNMRVTLHILKTPQRAEAARMAFTAILRYKSRGLDAFTNQIQILRRNASPDAKQLLDQLTDVQSQLARLLISVRGDLKPLARKTRIELLSDERERLEEAISLRSKEFRASTQTVTIDSVRRALPTDSALVEIFFYIPFKYRLARREYGTPHYVAYVLRHDADEPRFVDLGEIDSLNEEVARFRSLLQTPTSTEAQLFAVARNLDERIMQPVRGLLGSIRRIFLAPDGAMNLIPFGALVDENHQYLIENYSINYLTSGRDLLRLQATGGEPTGPASIVANPQFDLTRDLVTCNPVSRKGELLPSTPDSKVEYHATDFTRLCYSTLNGTAQEATQIQSLLPGARVLTAKDATEAALKGLRRPRVLHIATHGFFLADQPQALPASGRLLRGTFDTLGESSLPAGWKNPLLRSGLILAGVKQASSGAGEDGVLTALEVAGLDLWGTKLVVLSACDTGLGEVHPGAGVFGLRRALVLAGSETQVMSLWKVSDAGTSDLMTAYYTRLQKSEGRSEAMRQVQLAMLHGQPKTAARSWQRGTIDSREKVAMRDYRHPYYWAAFIQSGDWRSMDGK